MKTNDYSYVAFLVIMDSYRTDFIKMAFGNLTHTLELE